jgi:hypothetical protein
MISGILSFPWYLTAVQIELNQAVDGVHGMARFASTRKERSLAFVQGTEKS